MYHLISLFVIFNIYPLKFLKATSLYLVDYDSDSFFKKVFINSCHFVVGTTAKNFIQNIESLFN